MGERGHGTRPAFFPFHSMRLGSRLLHNFPACDTVCCTPFLVSTCHCLLDACGCVCFLFTSTYDFYLQHEEVNILDAVHLSRAYHSYCHSVSQYTTTIFSVSLHYISIRMSISQH